MDVNVEVHGVVSRLDDMVSITFENIIYILDRDQAQRLSIALGSVIADIDIRKDFKATRVT